MGDLLEAGVRGSGRGRRDEQQPQWRNGYRCEKRARNCGDVGFRRPLPRLCNGLGELPGLFQKLISFR